MTDDVYDPLESQEQLPPLPTRPLWGRRVFGIGVFVLLGMAFFFFALDTLLPSDPETPVSAQCDSSQAVFQLDPAQSEARYQADEKRFGESGFSSPIGRTNSLAGYLVLDFENLALSRLCEMVVNVSQLSSDQPERDRLLQTRFLQSELYPNAYFEATQVLNFPAKPQMGEPLRFGLRGNLRLRNISAPVEWSVRLTFFEDRLEGVAEGVILLSTYGIGPIRLAGVTETADDVTLTLEFVALKIE